MKNGESSLLYSTIDHPFIHYTTRLSLNTSNSRNIEYFSKEVTFSESNMTSTKSKVPDILMINKYYGLIPQKFTISSRKTVNSTPSSAGNSRRSIKSSNANKPRAKSSTHHGSSENRRERFSFDESKGFRSENDSPEPIKMILVHRQSSAGGLEISNENLSDPFGPVTKKMSVERYKKWKNGGGGKGKNMNMRSNSDIGQTLSLLDNGLPGGGFNSSHARNNNRASTAAEFTTNRRVIKIDLNRVSSWDEENYHITTTSSLDSCTTCSSTRGENKESQLKVAANNTTRVPMFEVCLGESRNTTMSSFNNSSYGSSSCNYSLSSMSLGMSSSEGKSSPISATRLGNNGNYSCLVNNDNDCHIKEGQKEQTTFLSSTDTSEETNESSSENVSTVRDSSAFNSCGTSLEFSSSSVLNDNAIDGETQRKELLRQASITDDNNEQTMNMQLFSSSLIGSVENGQKTGHYDSKVVSMQKSGKLSSRTISFDDRMLVAAEGTESTSKSDSSAKKRPTTASARYSNKTFTTPNGFNPPSKVIPWTQQKSAGGKALTLAERRAKLQRAPSIHCSNSLSIENGEEETFSEVETSNFQCVRPPSSAFRESRKPLHVTQPPEIPTMVSQINPNADEDIQIEIEKVALMLKKMHSSKHFSMSLDSGIDAEMVRPYIPREHGMTSPISKNSSCASTNSIAAFPETAKVLKTSISESSVSSEPQSSSSEEEDRQGKLNSASSIHTAKSVPCGDLSKSRENIGSSSDNNLIKRQCSLNNNSSISIAHYNLNTETNSIKKINSVPLQPINSTAKIGTGSTLDGSTTTVRRHSLKKAASISCEQEVLKADGNLKRNGVNFNANDNGKSPRPKTAVVPTSHQRSNVSGTRSIQNNCQHRHNGISSGESHQTGSVTMGTTAGSQGSRNRKILIKKALMEINQSSVNMRKKWGTLGRPRTAPNTEKSNNAAHHNVSRSLQTQQHPRKPMKASPFPISSNGRMGLPSSGKTTSTGGGKASDEVMQGEKPSEKGGPTGQIQRSSSEAPAEDSGDKSQASQLQQHSGESSSKGRSAFRQCFSLDESALLGFSIKSVNGGRIPIFEKLASAESTESCPSSIMDDEISFLSSKKREQCLKVYEKMMKTGCTIKLETVFRGMLTPSEYRAFMRAAEKANQEAEEEALSSQLIDESLPSEVQVVSSPENEKIAGE